MKQDKHILPILGLGLHFCAMNLYLAMMVVGRGAVSNGRAGIVAHFMLAPVCALLLVLFSRFFGVQSESCSAQAEARGGLPVFRLVRQPLPLLLLCSAALSVAWGFSLTTESLSFYGNLLPPALAMSLCLPVGLRLFFRTIPPERQGLLLGLAMASGELVWIILLPVFSAVFNASGADASLPGPVSSGMALHIFTIFCLFQAGTALCFAVTLALGESGTGKTAHHDAGLRDSSGVLSAPVSAALLLLFLAGLCFFALFGMAFLENMPRTTVNPASPGNLHYFLLVSAPLAGLLLDRFAAVKGESASAATLQSGTSSPAPASLLPLFTLLALAALGAPLLGFLQNGAPSGSLAGGLLGFLNLAREALLLTLYIFIFRLAGTSRWFIVLATLAYSLYLAQFPSARLGQALTASGGRGLWIAAEFCLAFGFALSLGAFGVWLHRHPEYAVPPLPPSEPEKELPLSDEAAVPLLEHEAKFRAFCAAFDLSGREMEVLECIVRGLEREVIGLELAISESTVKFHIRRLLKKAAMPDRQRLLHYYTTWKAE